MTSNLSPQAILQQLIPLASQNPMGHPTSGTGWLEGAMSAWLGEFFTEHQIPWEYHEIEPERGNVIALLEGDPTAETVLLDAHQDTVPFAGMTIDPLDPLIRDGRIYGRGACDVKGPMACILATVARLKQQPVRRHRSVIVSCTCDEERGQKGARELARRLSNPADGILRSHRPDIAIVSEPTELNPVVAHKGTARWKIRTQGVAAHSSDPSQGENAIYKMGPLLQSIQNYVEQLGAEDAPRHQLCGAATMSVGTISGGTSVNIVPDRCQIEIDRRVIPGETPQQAIAKASEALGAREDDSFEFLTPDTMSNPLVDGINIPLAKRIVESARGIVDDCSVKGVAFTTHAPRIAALGIPTVVYGPGSIAQAHTKDEWISIEQLDQSCEILYKFLTQ